MAAGGPADPETDDDWEYDQGPTPAPLVSARDDLALLDRADATLSAVEETLRRFDDGSYGTCEVCGASLSSEELEADPVLARCSQHSA
jgi:RNA polymerase-binding transcription factor DksA